MKVLDFLKKYKVHVLATLLLILFFRSCGKSRTITKLEKDKKQNVEAIDSLESLISVKNAKIDSFPEILRKEKLAIHLMYNDTMSKMIRTPQTQWLQNNITIPNIKKYLKINHDRVD
jgi:PBP1b-binding outer membrane lipoprotein LpoB